MQRVFFEGKRAMALRSDDAARTRPCVATTSYSAAVRSHHPNSRSFRWVMAASAQVGMTSYNAPDVGEHHKIIYYGVVYGTELPINREVQGVNLGSAVSGFSCEKDSQLARPRWEHFAIREKAWKHQTYKFISPPVGPFTITPAKFRP